MNNNYYSFKVNQDWNNKSWPEEGSIFEFLAHDFDFDTKLTTCVFKLIGKPVDKEASTKVYFTELNGTPKKKQIVDEEGSN